MRASEHLLRLVRQMSTPQLKWLAREVGDVLDRRRLEDTIEGGGITLDEISRAELEAHLDS